MAASVAPAIFPKGEKIHREHQILAQVLHKLEAALDGLTWCSEVSANLATAAEVGRYGRLFAEQLPGHCQREEVFLLDPAAQISPELDEFCRQIKAEHTSLLAQTAAFRAALDDFDSAEDPYAAVWRVKDLGKALIAVVRRHVAKEEQELSGFL